MGWTPKVSMDLATCEIARLLKLTGNAIEPISFTVPRKGDIFQDDLYPPTAGGEPALSADKWLSGSNSGPKMTSLAPGYVPPKPQEASFKAVVVEEKKLSEKELRDENEKMKKRIAHLESEVAKKDARIRDLESQ